MDAIVTVKFKFNNVCNKEDLESISFEDMVKYLIKEEGLFGVVEEDYEIVEIKEQKNMEEESENNDILNMETNKINYLKGDATQPVITPACIVHIVNNIGAWGSGFVIAVSKRFGKGPESAYKAWFRSKIGFALGEIQINQVGNNVCVINMVAQSGIVSSYNIKPLNLKALRKCLKLANQYAKSKNMTIHMPRIGCGLAGGKWEEVEPIIKQTALVDTYVYDLV